MNILILSSGTRNKVVQYFKEALAGKGKVIATDCSPYAPAIYEADEYVLVPRITEPGYLDKILEICREKQITYMGTEQVVMPENYIAMFNAPQAEEARQIVAKAEPDIDRVISAIAANQAFTPSRNNLYDRFMSGPVNPIFYSFFVKANAFVASDACTGCGQCARLCPTNNITIQNGKPVWGGDCTHCMACICRCGAEAIEYGKKSLGKPRYHFDAL